MSRPALCPQCRFRVPPAGKKLCGVCFGRHKGDPRTVTGIPAWQYRNPCVYVQASDLPVRGFVDENAAELEQWRLRDELGPTTLGICAILAFFRGLRHGKDGCGAQLSVDEWSNVLGRSERQVQYALREGANRGFLKVRQRFVDHQWGDRGDSGHTPFKRVQVVSVVYLTDAGARRLERRGETRRSWVRWGAHRFGLVVCGAAEKLLTATRSILKATAKRVTDALDHCTPPFWKSQPIDQQPEVRSSSGVVGNSTGPPDRGKVPPDGGSSDFRVPPPDFPGLQRSMPWGPYGGGRHRAHLKATSQLLHEVESLWTRRAFTAATAWPDVWNHSDAQARRWLTEEFEKYKPELTRRLKAETAKR